MRLGLLLVGLKVLAWAVALGAPVAWGATTETAAWSGGTLVVSEVLFWIGIALLGKPVWTSIREKGWRRVPHALWHRFFYGDDEPLQP